MIRVGCAGWSLPRAVQLVGGLLILAGVLCVKLGEQDTATSGPAA